MIEKIHLDNFRSFKKKEIEIKKDLTIIFGDNTKGKSTILEAIYLVLNGSSPWKHTYENLINYNTNEDYFAIKITSFDKNTYRIYQDQKTKTYLLDNKKTTKKKFFSFGKANLFSPEKIELLMYLPERRREFLDTLISDINWEYKNYLNTYKRVLKQRNAHLKKLSKKFFETKKIEENDPQIKYWDKMLAELAAKIMKERAQIIEKLQNDNFKLQYAPSITLNLFEDMLNTEEIEEIYKKQIQKNIKKDIVTGFSNIGVHRDNWKIFSQKKDLRSFGSRGEKRLGIANLILETQEIYKEYLGYYPLLLLDDISAELDSNNTEKIFSNNILEKQQTIITTPNPENLPKSITKKSKIIDLN